MKQFQKFFYLITLLFLSACDGDSLEGTKDEVSIDETSAIVVTVDIDNSQVDATNSAVISAKVTDDGSRVSGVVVSFSSDLGLFDVESATALTNSDGIATIGLSAGSVEGASTVFASVDSGESGSIGFYTKGDAITENPDQPDNNTSNKTIALQLVAPNTVNSVSTINVTSPGQLVATVTGLNGPAIVTFTSDIGEIPIATAITSLNAEGEYQAVVDIYAGNKLGAGTVTASLKDGETGEKLLVVGATTLLMGSGTPFVENEAELSLEQISAGGTTVVSVNIVDEEGNPYTLPVEVNFSSNCASSGVAKLSSPVVTSNGIANSTYLAEGCVGDDPITVSANAGGVNLSSSTTVNVLPADAGSLEFVSVSPENISLKGVGGEESSVVVFRVLNTNGNPVANTSVDFSLNTDVGGITLEPASATSNNEGLVQTVVNSGTVSTSVRLTASITNTVPLISSQSSQLVISTGIPDQDSFSLSAEMVNPEGWDVDGNTVAVTARLADAFNNPVPDGTAISFRTEGGSIDPSCVTLNGTCSVTWVSQNPRPEGKELIDGALPELQNSLGQKFGGRATISATAIGEESFPDSNGNGRFDASEVAAFAGNDVSGNAYDLTEAFVDHNEDGVFDITAVGGENEVFSDFNNDGAFNDKDGMYNGSLCSEPMHAGCALEESLNVRGELVLVMSGSEAFLDVAATIDAHETIDIIGDTIVNITGENTGGATVIIADLHNQPMPKGTLIEFTTTAGTIIGPDSFIWPNDNHNGGRAFSVSIEGEDEPKSGSLIIEITTPSGYNTIYSPISVVITAPTPEPEV